MTEICVASHHGSLRELLADGEFRGLAGKPGFLVELRLDGYSDVNPETFDAALKVFGPAAVVTFRRADEGGKNAAASDAERRGWLQRAADAGVRYIDLEWRTPLEGLNPRTSTLIRSAHDFQRVPPLGELQALWAAIRASGGLPKIAVMPATIHETLPLLDLLETAQRERVPTIVLAMQEAGLWTRILAGRFGAPFTFARGAGAPGTAPGQPTWQELDGLYRARELNASWPVYAVIGAPIAHSLSPLMHNTGLQALQRRGVYLPLKVEGDPVPVVRALQRAGLCGVSVTIPHKEAVQPLCAELDPVAKRIGAVNTLQLRKDGTWYGTNTDASAAAESLVAKTGPLEDKRVVILGAGGAARAVGFGVKARGADVFVVNRTFERAETLAQELNATALPMEELKMARPDVVVNTTPLGMHPNVNATPVEIEELPEECTVFDTVYNPLQTRLLRLARERGHPIVDGLEMFVGQGVQQFELWTGVKAPREAMRSVVLHALRERQAKH